MWQDYFITFAIIAFGYALLPQVIQGFKKKKGYVNLQTSGITCIGMYLLTYVYFTLDLIFSCTMAFFTGSLWLVLFIQRIIYK